MNNEQPNQELVKCVVVGDTAVGKTRLICGRACNKRISLSQLLSTHVPTVWAIDQYRMCKDVLERSWEIVDGVHVSLRLWDTFGDHEKDRRFAYGRSDVVLLCFSVTSQMSLRNCRAMWYQEIRQYCPQTPVLLVGCKSDLRYMYRDETYLHYFRDKSPFARPVRKNDLIMPEEARALAHEFGIYYYETSVLTYYGVNEVFENAIRAALISRRHQRFWMTNLKKVQRPLLQIPCCPPKPIPLPVEVQPCIYDENLLWLWQTKAYTDVAFIVGNVELSAHKFVLAAASATFYHLFCMDDDISQFEMGRSSSESSLLSVYDENLQTKFNEDADCFAKPQKSFKLRQQSRKRPTYQILNCSGCKRSKDKTKNVKRKLDHPIFLTIKTECNRCKNNRKTNDRAHTTVVLSDLITSATMLDCLQFVYTGTIETKSNLQDLILIAELIELDDLRQYIRNIETKNEFQNNDLKQRYILKLRKKLAKLCLEENVFTDVVFQLDDGMFAAHRALLSARCDVMRAMFSGNFKEKVAKVIMFPGVSLETFSQLLAFLYNDDIKSVTVTKCIELIELANRLCLTRLINLVEKRAIEELNKFTSFETSDAIQPCLKMLETCKLHNADQLADWCMIYLCVNYNKLCKMSPKLLKNLHRENQEFLMEHRWPPVWYLKDRDYYVKRVNEKQEENKAVIKRSSSNFCCLCFGSCTYEKTSPEHYEPPITVTWKIR